VVDGASLATLGSTLASLTPTNAFSQTMLANSFSHRFTGQIAQRTLSLRGGNQAAAGFSAAGGAVAGIAQTGAAEPGKLGFFSTVSGSFLVTPEQRGTGANALEEAAFTQAGELTLGADLRMSEDLTVGFAMTSVRNGMAAAGAQPRADDTSFSGAVYAAMQLGGGGFTDMYLGFARQNFGVDRAVQGDLTAATHSAFGRAEGRQTFGGMRVGYAFDILPGLEAGPVASVDYVRNDLGGYSEVGAGQFGLNVLDRTFTSVGGKAGMMAALETGVGRRGRLTAFGSVAYARELADTQDVVTATFAGSNTPFSIVNQLDTSWVAASAGADLALGSRFSIGVSGHSDLGRGVLTNNQARMNFSWKF